MNSYLQSTLKYFIVTDVSCFLYDSLLTNVIFGTHSNELVPNVVFLEKHQNCVPWMYFWKNKGHILNLRDEICSFTINLSSDKSYDNGLNLSLCDKISEK